MSAMKTIAIIGGGAAGLAAAVCAAREVHGRWLSPGEDARVVIYEADERVGRSILATGNGRCNFTNACIDAELYHNAAFVSRALDELEAMVPAHGAASTYANAVQAFFASLGLEWREEGEGRMYPYANKASSVLDVLRGAALALGVEERCSCEVSSIDPPSSSGGRGSRFTMKLADGSFERSDAVIVACGGSVARRLLPDGFAFAEPAPTLGPLATDLRIARQLDNIRVRGVARLLDDENELAREAGEVLFRKYGLSGIAIFNLSRFARPGNVIELDLLPFLGEAFDACETEAYALGRYDRVFALAEVGPTCASYLRGLMLPQVARVVAKLAGFDENDVLERVDAPRLIMAFRSLRFTCEGMADARQCQVHRGGFCVEGFDARTMESRDIPALYMAGEALDVDAPCGGYNLHWAWASGMLAGRSAASRIAAIEEGSRI